MSKFKFFRGLIKKARVINLQNRIYFVEPRYPRIPSRQIPYPEDYTTDFKRIFRQGWRSCEQGGEIYNNPYSDRETLIYSLHQTWERGYLECYHHHPSRRVGPTNEQCYLNGWEYAQQGFDILSNPWVEGTEQHSMFILGWNDYFQQNERYYG
jgi:hypothetical protein